MRGNSTISNRCRCHRTAAVDHRTSCRWRPPYALCKDCVDCVADLQKANVEFLFCDFADSLIYLKEFLKIRDENSLFDSVREKGSIGIPCIVREDGSVTLIWDEYVSQD